MSHTSALTRKPKGLGRRNFAQGYPRWRATPTPTSRSKGQKSRSRGGSILWRPPSHTACFSWSSRTCNITTTMCTKKRPPFYFSNNSSQKLADFNNLWCTESWGNLRLVGYKFAHFAWKVSLHYLVKFRTIIVTSLLQKYDKKMF